MDRNNGQSGIQKIYEQCVKIVCGIDDMDRYYRDQNDNKFQQWMSSVVHMTTNLVAEIEGLQDQVLKEYEQHILQNMQQVIQAQELKDYIGMNDVMQYDVKKAFMEFIAYLGRKGCSLPIQVEKLEEISDRYVLKDSDMGMYALQLQDQESEYCLCSIRDPYAEGMQIAQNIYRLSEQKDEDGLKTIHVLGLGAGYHIAKLAEYQDVLDIYVYETDASVVQIAQELVKELRQSDKIHIIQDERLTGFTAAIKRKDVNIYIYRPAIANIQDARLRQVVEDFYLVKNSVEGQGALLYKNYAINQKLHSESIDLLKNAFYKKDMILVAGGPSLDEDMEQLKEIANRKGDDHVIVAVGTVLRKLIHNGVIPDYVVITDPQEGMIHQIAEVNDGTYPTVLLYLSTIAAEVPKNWHGRQYVIYQEGWSRAEQFAKEHGGMLIATGGSVSTTAFDIGLKMECRSIILLGLDLAFYKNVSHASGTMGSRTVADTGIYVDSVMGGKVMTSRNLYSYLKWFKQRIEIRTENEKKTRIINCSKGALIDGIETQELKKVNI